LGALEIRIPRLRSGSYQPSFLEPRCRMHESLVALVCEAYSAGISMRKFDDLATVLGMESLSKSTVSRMVATLDEDVAAFQARELEPCPYVFLDARYDKVREHGRVVSMAVLIAVGVTKEGRRQLLGMRVAPREDVDTWGDMLRDLVQRGLRGIRLVVSDAHAGLRQAITETFGGASGQRCPIHLMRNLAAAVGQQHRAEVMALVKLILASASIEEARDNLRGVLSILEMRHPKVARILDGAGEDFLAFMHFPSTHWRKLHSTNLVERLNRELKRRSRVVSIFPNAQSLTRLSMAVLERVTGHWPAERYISPDRLRDLDGPGTDAMQLAADLVAKERAAHAA